MDWTGGIKRQSEKKKDKLGRTEKNMFTKVPLFIKKPLHHTTYSPPLKSSASKGMDVCKAI